MPEYRKIIETSPVLLYRNDIHGIARLLDKIFPDNEKTSSSFSLSIGDVIFRAKSVAEILLQELPPVVDGLHFSVADIERNCGISLSLYAGNGNCHIYALDEIWFKGVINQITDFLRARRPWYLPISRSLLAGILGGCVSSSLFAIVLFTINHSILGAILAGLLFISLSFMDFMYFKYRLFAHTKIILQDSNNKFNTETLLIIVTAILALFTGAEVIIKIAEHFAK